MVVLRKVKKFVDAIVWRGHPIANMPQEDLSVTHHL